MAEQLVVPRRILSALLTSLSAGVVPRTGAPYIAIGRVDEIAAIKSDLDKIADGGSALRLLIGKYGSGKSFLIQLMRGHALENGFICADADLSPSRKLHGSSGSGVATYRELIKNLATKSSPDGGALGSLISRWLSSLQLEAAKEHAPDSHGFHRAVELQVFAVTSKLSENVGGFDFACAINHYYKAHQNGNEEAKNATLRWLRGEYLTRTAARADGLPVGSIIDDNNWYDFIKLFAAFAKEAGYSGLLVFIDECVNLYKITNRISRENNYEKLLAMLNDCLQGQAPHLGIIFGGTPQFLEDPRRGLFSYEALKSRLNDTRMTNVINMNSPIIRLRRMSDNELFALLHRLKLLHEQYHSEPSRLTEQNDRHFLTICLARVGADTQITPREIIREYVNLLDIMHQNPSSTYDQLVSGGVNFKPEQPDDEFTDFDFLEI